VPVGFAPVRQAGAAVVDDVHVHDQAAAYHRHRHPRGIGGVLDRVGHQLAHQQLGVAAGRMAGQDVPEKAPGGRDLLGAPGERPRRGGRRGVVDRAPRLRWGGDSK
jgi:hypothetical protein